jgi:hypothetical protein
MNLFAWTSLELDDLMAAPGKLAPEAQRGSGRGEWLFYEATRPRVFDFLAIRNSGRGVVSTNSRSNGFLDVNTFDRG